MLRNTAGTLAPHVDTRAHGGYVVAPPTTLPGGSYRVARDVPVAPLPGWLAAALTPALSPEDAAPVVPLRRLLPGRQGKGQDRAQERARAYVDAAVAGELRRVATASEGQRNRALFIAAVALGQLAAGGALTAAEVRRLLRGAAAPHVRARAYTAREAEATIRSGLRIGSRRPRQIAS